MDNREFKFRICSKNDIVYCDNIFEVTSKFKQLNLFISDKAYIQQFTSLYDRKNQEIYEGDIVLINNIHGECTGENVIGVIAFTHGYYYVCDNIDDEPLHEFCIDKTEKLDLEIIGNVFENPELLK